MKSLLNHLFFKSFWPFTALLWAVNSPGLPCYGQAPRFDRISSETGIAQSAVTAIQQDSKQFIWIGTENGLSRYDGHNFKLFPRHISGNNSLADKNIRKFLMAENDVLWIATGGGLACLDIRTELFINFRHNENEQRSISNNEINALAKGAGNYMWLGTQNGLNRFDTSTTHSLAFFHNEGIVNSLSHNAVRALAPASGGRLWVGTEAGLDCFDPKKESFEKIALPDSVQINALVQQGDSILWVATSQGLLRAKVSENQNKTSLLDYEYFLKGTSVYAIEKGAGGTYWAATDKGLAEWKPKGYFVLHKNDEDDMASIGSNRLASLFHSPDGLLWIGTQGEGLNLMQPGKSKFSPEGGGESQSVFNIASISTSDVLPLSSHSAAAAAGGQLRVFSWNRGVLSEKLPKIFPGLYAKTISGASEGSIWIAGIGETVYRYTPGKGKTEVYPLFSKGRNAGSQEIRALVQLPDGQVWAGSSKTGLYKLNQQKACFERFFDPDSSRSLISKHSVSDIKPDSKGNLWIATKEGLTYLDTKRGVFNDFSYTQNGLSLKHKPLKTLCLSKNGQTLWVGTDGMGLVRLGLKQTDIVSYTGAEGLPGNSVYAIEEAEWPFLWISTDKGLVKFDTQNQKFACFHASDGLQSERFAPNASASRKGLFFFGGENGLNVFKGSDIKKDSTEAVVAITQLFFYNKPYTPGEKGVLEEPLTGSIPFTDRIFVDKNVQVISFEFAALHFGQPDRCEYSYRLEGFHDGWINTKPNQRTAAFTGLPPGEYTLFVKSTNNDGVWGSKTARLVIVIPPPLWKSTSFYWMSTPLVFLVFLGLYYYNVQNLKKQKAKLNRMIMEGSLEIIQQNVDLREQKEEISAQSQELKNTNAKLNEEIEKNNTLKQFKNDMLQTIVHDFKNPLNVILGTAQHEKQSKNITTIAQSAKQLQNMVDNILDIAKMEEAKMPLDKEMHNLHEIVDKAVTEVEILYVEKHIHIQNLIPKHFFVELDLEKMRRLFVNMLTNAIKFTNINGHIKLAAVEAQNQTVKISVEDTGAGIPKIRLESIFDRYAQVEARNAGQAKSTGLGLTFCKMVTEEHGGTIWAESEMGKGSTFFMLFPGLSIVKENEIYGDLQTHDYLQELHLGPDQIAEIRMFKEEYAEYSCYDSGNWVKILRLLEKSEDPEVRKWAARMESTVFCADEKSYRELLGMLG